MAQWYLDSVRNGARRVGEEVAQANREPDFGAKAPGITAKSFEHKRYQVIYNRFGAGFRMRDRVKVRMQKNL